jgi:hypothetical protein
VGSFGDIMDKSDIYIHSSLAPTLVILAYLFLAVLWTTPPMVPTRTYSTEFAVVKRKYFTRGAFVTYFT